ncbi:hypothetical protein Enr13x_07660 [Stieleria neptunia]|uniref:Uncharacterized protein n=2 Tax=Stieleria neptunia TaxID=2527979 RepID=A0A518HJA2_9BACT|nr:hypothetical protein Enr13x_07660 [Stieleria neptunia]
MYQKWIAAQWADISVLHTNDADSHVHPDFVSGVSGHQRLIHSKTPMRDDDESS